MARIPDHFIDEVLSRVDLVELIAERVTLKRSGSNHLGLCPFHSEKTPSFTVSQSKQFYHCFGCGANGTAIRFLMEYDRLEFRDAIELLAERVGMALPEDTSSAARGDRHNELYKVLEDADRHYQQWLRRHPQRARAVDYLKRRGVDGQTAARFGLGFAPPGWDNLVRAIPNKSRSLLTAGLAAERQQGGLYDRLRDRIVFPIRDRRGRVIGFGGRVLDDSEPKYLNSPETPVFHKGRELYGLYECLMKVRHPEKIVVVEGYMDVVALAQHGVDEAVATLGTATSTEQVERLFQVTKQVVFCFDGDRAGRQAAWRALENALPAMRGERQASFLFLPEGEDPDSVVRREGADGFRARLKNAQAFSEFFFDSLSADIDMTSLDGNARLAERATAGLNRLPPGPLRQLMLDRVAQLTRLTTEQVEAGMQAAARRGRRGAAPRAENRRKQAPLRVERTPIRLAIALLLQRPALAASVDDISDFAEHDIPGLDLLSKLLALTQANPQFNTGTLLERFRDSEHEKALWKLATWEHLVPEEGQESEFTDALIRIRGLIARQRLQYLSERFTHGELTAEELREWQALKTGGDVAG